MKRRRSCRSGGTGTGGEAAAATQRVRVTSALGAAAKPRRAELLQGMGACLMMMRQVGRGPAPTPHFDPSSKSPLRHLSFSVL